MEASLEFKKIIFDNDDEERDILEQFLFRLKLEYDFLTKTEKPDFILELDNKKFGFEITKYYSDKNRKGSKSFKLLKNWVSFTKDIRARLNDFGGDYHYYYGAIFFKKELNDFKNFDRNKFLDEFSKGVKGITLKKGETKKVLSTEFNSNYLNEILESITMENIFPIKKPFWWLSTLQSGTVNIDFEKLNEIIIKKESKAINNYNEDLDSKYLLIYASGLGLNDILIISDDQQVKEVKRQGKIMLHSLSEDKGENILSTKNINIESEIKYFDNIYTFDHFTETIWEIYPKVRKVFDYGEKTIWVNRRPMK